MELHRRKQVTVGELWGFIVLLHFLVTLCFLTVATVGPHSCFCRHAFPTMMGCNPWNCEPEHGLPSLNQSLSGIFITAIRNLLLRISHWTYSSLIQLNRFASKSQKSSCLYLSSTGVTGVHSCAWLFLWVLGILNSGPHACNAIILFTEPSP